MGRGNRYQRIIEEIFRCNYREGAEDICFTRDDIVRVAGALGVNLPKNLGDLIYSFGYRTDLPESVTRKAPEGKQWMIRPAGTARYRFVARAVTTIVPNSSLAETKVPDATPGLIEMYAFSDEQALLAKVRYNRLIDVFTGVTCYPLQSHLRTTVKGIGQIETDELYVGVDRRGAHYIFPVQAKGGRDRLSIIQIEQDFAMCADRFPSLIRRPIGAQFMVENLIALFEFEEARHEIVVANERHYRLVPAESMTDEDLAQYRSRPVE